MDSGKLCRALRAMVPPGVFVAAGPACRTILTARERASLGDANENRVREFESGRAYAKSALAMLGIPDADLPKAASHAPSWPSGVVGSITHVQDGLTDNYVGVAVARTDVACGLGIDFETGPSIHPNLWPHVFTQRELERLLALPIETRPAEAQYLWCAKEATAKTAMERIRSFRNRSGPGYCKRSIRG